MVQGHCVLQTDCASVSDSTDKVVGVEIVVYSNQLWQSQVVQHCLIKAELCQHFTVDSVALICDILYTVLGKQTGQLY